MKKLSAPRISIDRLWSDLTELGKIGENANGGRTRLALSAEDHKARSLLISKMREAGLEVRVDKAGNIIGRRKGIDDSSKIVAFGSHIDTVPNAGMFDGCLGVLAGLEVVRTLNESNIVTNHPLELICFSNEEGVRFPLMTGSRVATGSLPLEEAYSQRDSSNITYLEALRSGGLNPENLAVPLRKKGEFKAWVELHIEQGPLLYSEKVNIGVVQAIAGISQWLLEIGGKSGHAGTTPMRLRKDPVIGVAKIVLEINRMAKEGGEGVFGTVGIVKTFPSAINVIANKAETSIDFRDIVKERLDQSRVKIMKYVDETLSELGLSYTIKERARLEPTPMSKLVIDAVVSAAEKLGVSYRLMPSGAVHDTQNMARVSDVGMIFVPSRDGVSHAPDEWTDARDVENGANVLLHTILQLAS
ncbi:MAG: M20 family metallo-hydrolase [Candidatus Caldarchaeum sp.]|nr:M20 family metallo-hydrolase [Candidatus Caldarchaeum sp.]